MRLVLRWVLPAIAAVSLAACGSDSDTSEDSSKVSEAEVMAAAGIGDIFIANQIVVRRKIKRLLALSKKGAHSSAPANLHDFA